MKLIYYVPSDTTYELCKTLKEILSDDIPKTEKQKYSEFTLRESIQTLKGLEVMADNKAKCVEFIPNNNNKLYEMRFQMIVEEGYPPKKKRYAVITKFEAILINSDYDDMTILIRMDESTKAMNLTLCFSRNKLETYVKREKFEGKEETEVEYLRERTK